MLLFSETFNILQKKVGTSVQFSVPQICARYLIGRSQPYQQHTLLIQAVKHSVRDAATLPTIKQKH